MSHLLHRRRQAHMHLAWESQPLVRSTPRPRGWSGRIVLLAFVAGLLLGLCI